MGMMWNESEIRDLFPILERIEKDIEPLDGRTILVLCSAAGDVALWLGGKMRSGQVIGLELSDELLKTSRDRLQGTELKDIVRFQKADPYRIPFPDEMFDALVSEFIIYPTSLITEIGQPEMARVLKPGGKMILTDVIVTKPLDEETRKTLTAIGFDYLCEATPDDFRGWMANAGLTNSTIRDFTPLLEGIWARRRENDAAPDRQGGYLTLLEDPELRLGEGIFYIYIRGEKERTH